MQRKQILWTDNDGRARFLYEHRLLSRAGYDVAWAVSIREATRLIASRSFDLLIVDQLMPYDGEPGATSTPDGDPGVWGGWYLLQWLRCLDPMPGPAWLTGLSPVDSTVPVLFLSAYQNMKVEEALRATSAQDADVVILRKPLDESELVAAVDRILR